VTELIAASQLVSSFDHIQGRQPKCKLFVAFYPQFLTVINQTKHDQDAIKTVIKYADIERIVCVPEKNDDIYFYAKLNKKVPLKWRKGAIDHFAVTFEDLSGYEDEEDEELQICNLNTSLPATLRGTTESMFCRVMSTLCNKSIDRHDRNLFRIMDDSKKHIFFIDANIKFNKCCVYPLKSGLFITPKPLCFIPQTKIKYYEFSRKGEGLRYFDLDIILFPEENEDEQKEQNEDDIKKKKKKKKGENEINLSMIPNSEMPQIENYFRSMNIGEKNDAKQQKKNKNKNTNNKESEDDEEDDDEMEADDLSESDDEEYCVENDGFDYAKDDFSDSDEYEEAMEDQQNAENEENEDSENEDEENEDIDIEIKEKGKKNNSDKKKEKKQPKKNRKRKRAEMEKGHKENKENREIVDLVDDDSDDQTMNEQEKNRNFSPRKRFKRNVGRKTTNYGMNGAKIRSKSIEKKNRRCFKVHDPSKAKTKSESVEILGVSSPFKDKHKNKSSNPLPPSVQKRNSGKKSKSKSKRKHKKKDGKQRNLNDFFQAA